jgi:hypothetical protein
MRIDIGFESRVSGFTKFVEFSIIGLSSETSFWECTEAPDMDVTSFSVIESTSRVCGVDMVFARRFIVDFKRVINQRWRRSVRNGCQGNTSGFASGTDFSSSSQEEKAYKERTPVQDFLFLIV